MSRRWEHRSLVAVIVFATWAVSGCPSAEDCHTSGTCEPGTSCMTGADCASGACGALTPGRARECWATCTTAADCPGGWTCETVSGAGPFCQFPASTIDSGTNSDAGAPADTGPEVDNDEDGIGSTSDCDDSNLAIGRMSVEECTSDCGFGTIVCTNGIRSACSAPTDCSCPMPGEVRSVACGRCGMATRTCGADGRWATSTCGAERTCVAGTEETRSYRCGLQDRTCTAACEWGDWSDRTATGACDPGETIVATTPMCGVGAEEVRECDDTCTFGEPECRALCSIAARRSRRSVQRVCVPSGQFLLGNPSVTGRDNDTPQRTISLSDFWIAQDPVTAGDYRACVEAGSCTPITDEDFATAPDGVVAIGSTRMQAAAYCMWDGGELPTEFQWEKSARGPAPSSQQQPWGEGTAAICEDVPGPGCPRPAEVAGFATSYSPYRVHLMGTMREWTSSHFRMGWSWVSDGSTEPAGPDATRYPNWTIRGAGVDPSGEPSVSYGTSWRIGVAGTDDATLGFRCVY